MTKGTQPARGKHLRRQAGKRDLTSCCNAGRSCVWSAWGYRHLQEDPNIPAGPCQRAPKSLQVSLGPSRSPHPNIYLCCLPNSLTKTNFLFVFILCACPGKIEGCSIGASIFLEFFISPGEQPLALVRPLAFVWLGNGRLTSAR